VQGVFVLGGTWEQVHQTSTETQILQLLGKKKKKKKKKSIQVIQRGAGKLSIIMSRTNVTSVTNMTRWMPDSFYATKAEVTPLGTNTIVLFTSHYFTLSIFLKLLPFIVVLK
jgi:hypothetical protein